MDDPIVMSIVDDVLCAYQACGPLEFGYGQGSTFTGFENDADLDIVLIWPDAIPSRAERPTDQLCDRDVAPVQFDAPEYGLDNIVIRGRDVQVAHYRRSTFDSWCKQVSNGEGWHGRTWPLPLHAVAGFVYGVPLADPRGEDAAARRQIAKPTAKLRNSTLGTVATALPDCAAMLTSSARRGESWLFHQLALPLIKQAYAAWFAAEGYYLPFPKHLDRWIERFGLNRELARYEQCIWQVSDLRRRQHAVMEFVERVVSIEPAHEQG